MAADEMELRLPLSEKNYNLLIEHTKASLKETKTREDFYFEIYSDRYYVLSTLPTPLKVRLMHKKDESKWQFQKKVNSQSLPPFTISETSSKEKKASNLNSFIALLKVFDDELMNLSPETLRSLKIIQKDLMTNNAFTSLLASCAECKTKGDFVPTHYNFKERTEFIVPLKVGELEIQIGKTENRGSWNYELEAEIKDKAHLKEYAVQLQKWLTEVGVDIKDIPQGESRPAADSLIKLNHLHSL